MLLDCARVKNAGELGSDAVGEPTEVTGVTGFMRSPLMATGAGKEVRGVASFGVLTAGERGGGGGRTFSRCALR